MCDSHLFGGFLSGFLLGVEQLRDVEQEGADTLVQVHFRDLIGHELSFSQSFLLGHTQAQSTAHYTGVILQDEGNTEALLTII